MNERPSVGAFLREVYAQWSEDRALTHGAALAYYTLFSLAPLLVLVIAIAGLAFGKAAAEGEIVSQMEGLVGPDGARMLQGMIEQASRPTSGMVATAASLATMFFGASGVVGQLQGSLNQIWHAPPPDPNSSAVKSALRRRAVAVGLILGVGFLLLVSLAVSAALAALHELVEKNVPLLGELLPPLNLAFSFLVITALFAMIYKLLPDVDLEWKDVWIGAAVTAVLFSIGKSLIGLYLGRAGVASVYGAAGSLVLVLLWIYYSAQLLFVGAEFTEVYARLYGSRRVPSADASLEEASAS